MAEEAKKGEDAAEKPKAGGKKKLIIIIAVVIVLIGVGVGAFFALGSGKGKKGEGEGEDEATEEAEEGGDEEHEEGEGLPKAIVPLDVFIVNLQVKGSFLKCTIQLQFDAAMVPHGFESETPKIRDSIIRVISGKTAQEILSLDGKEKLKDEIKTTVNETLGSEDITDVYFTEFIVQ